MIQVLISAIIGVGTGLFIFTMGFIIKDIILTIIESRKQD